MAYRACMVSVLWHKYSLSIILDPVIVSSSGHRLLSVDAQEVLKKQLLPISTLVTPNVPEMKALTNMPLTSYADKEAAALYLMDCGARSILLKGGHEEGDVKTDILFSKWDNTIKSTFYSSATINTKNTHGTGCTLSSAIAAFMAQGVEMEQSIKMAKDYVTNAICAGAEIEIGHGYGPVNHGFAPLKMRLISSSKSQF